MKKYLPKHPKQDQTVQSADTWSLSDESSSLPGTDQQAPDEAHFQRRRCISNEKPACAPVAARRARPPPGCTVSNGGDIPQQLLLTAV